MAIDPERLEAQRRELERVRIEADLLEARTRLRAAQVEAVRLGMRTECSRGCGREIGKLNRTGICSRCYRTEWEAKRREQGRAN